MNDIICEKINLFRRKKINNEKKRINLIIEIMNNYNCENNYYNKLIYCYSNIFKKLKEEEEEKIILLQETENYLYEQLNELILNNKSNFLIEELKIELKNIKKIKEKMILI